MANFQTLVEQYRTREKSAVIDSVTAGLSFADEVSVELGLLEDSGITDDLLNTVSLGLPFAVIALTEGGKVVMKKKTPTAAAQDASFRAIKTCTAMGAGAVVAATGAVGAALPAAVGTRMLIEKIRSNALMGRRVQQRIKRVRDLRLQREKRQETEEKQLLLED